MNNEQNVPLPYFDLLQSSPQTAGLELYLDAVASTIADLDEQHPPEARTAASFLYRLVQRADFAVEQIVNPLSTAPRLQASQMQYLHRRLLQSIADYKQRSERGTDYLDAVAIAIADLDEQNPPSRTTDWLLSRVQQQLKRALVETESWEALDAFNLYNSVVQATVAYRHQRRLEQGNPDPHCTLDPPCLNHPV